MLGLYLILLTWILGWDINDIRVIEVTGILGWHISDIRVAGIIGLLVILVLQGLLGREY